MTYPKKQPISPMQLKRQRRGELAALLLATLLLLFFPVRVLAQDTETSEGFLNAIDSVFSAIVAVLFKFLFYDIGGFPLIVLWLIVAGIFFTLRLGFINLRAFKHAIDVVRGRYDDPEEEGQVSHFQALATALSGTVGLGNIAGVAVAIQVGGPGAMFWLTLAGFLGMTTKLVECTLGLKYRIERPDGTVAGGPAYTLSRGLRNMGFGPLGKGLGIIFSVLAIFGSMGGANMFQSNQAAIAFVGTFPGMQGWIVGLVLAVLTAIVIIGGIERIASTTGLLVPAMAVIYILGCLWIVVVNLPQVPAAIATIISQAFVPEALEGGIEGGIIVVIVQGVRRSAFSNEAGIGSAAIAHSAARTDEPVREGIVALLEPFIDTIIICNMTGIMIVLTGVYQDTGEAIDGSQMTLNAFGTVSDWFPIVLTIAIFLFAFSTIISWSYYGEISWQYLFGQRTIIIYKLIFVACVFIGAVVTPGAVIDFSDLTLLMMALPNLIGAYFLSNEVAADIKDYMERLRSGQMPTYAEKLATLEDPHQAGN
ncbi:alanine/glycine:cation symporter family protein [Coleofasciculus chthonoplastes]|jgi:AGCS family alanine or glycine:cation symporter|uniref:alanine/glycine:cation symporter family protein n=1 Tax=Coleofasciculus chthonoplastes TaxID=64178 RepID=UPI00330251D2